MAVYAYSLANKQRDLSGVLNTVIAEKGTFLSKFKTAPKAKQHKHEWLQDKIVGRKFTVASYSSGTATLSAADVAKLKVGTRFRVEGYPVIFKVATVSGTTITATVHAANGNTSKTALAANDVCKIISTPAKEGSSSADGEETHRTIGSAENYTQIIRKDVFISGSALATLTYDQVENNIAKQTEFATQETERDLNRCAIWGVKTERSSDGATDGEAGGLYAFTTVSIDADGETLNSKLVNDAVSKITENGGNPTMIACSVDQARVLANEYKNKVTILREDKKRGIYANIVVNESNNQNIEIFGDVDFDDDTAFLIDDEALYISYLAGREFGDKDSTMNDTDGISRTVLGEFTFEFHNAAERICKITNLKDPATALSEISDNANTVTINATSVNVTSSEE